MSDDGQTAYRPLFGSKRTFLGQTALPTEGTSSFAVYVHSVGFKGLRIGVAIPSYDLTFKPGRDGDSWAVHSNGKTYHMNIDEKYMDPIKARDTVQVTLNREEGALYYSVNGNEMGRAFTHERLKEEELMPAVRLSVNAEVKLLSTN